MPVKIIHTLSLPVNATGQSPPTNKEETITIPMGRVAYPAYKDKNIYKGIIIFKPIIDALEVGCSVPIEDQEEIEKWLNSLVYKDLEDFHSLGPIDKKKEKKSTGYARSFYWLDGGKLDKQILINYAPKSGQKDFIKIVFQPSRLTTAHMDAFRDFWDSTFPNQPYMKLKVVFARPKAIKRLDIAVDMLNVHVASLVAKFVSEPKTKKKKSLMLYCNMTGRKETVYLLKVEYDAAKEKIYDKRQEILDKGGEYAYGELPLTRWERTIKTELAVYDLANKLKNHAADFDLKAFDFRAVEGKDPHYLLFANYALARTVEKAATLFPSPQAQSYSDFFTNNLIEFWQPEAIWDCWPEELKRLRLLKPAVVAAVAA